MKNFRITIVVYEIVLFLCAIVFAVASPSLHYSYMRPTYSLVIVVALCMPLVWRSLWRLVGLYRHHLRDRSKLTYLRSKIFIDFEFFKGRESAYLLAFKNRDLLYHSTQGVKLAIKHRGYIYAVTPPGTYKNILMIMKEQGITHVPSTRSQGILTDGGIFITMDQHAEAIKKQAKS